MTNKENDACRRLGSQNHYEPGDEIMYSMPEETGGAEPSTYDDQGESQRFLRNYTTAVAALATTYVALVVIFIIVSRMWDEDEIRLHVLNTMMRILQTIARICGGWALACEKAYNDYANALH